MTLSNFPHFVVMTLSNFSHFVVMMLSNFPHFVKPNIISGGPTNGLLILHWLNEEA